MKKLLLIYFLYLLTTQKNFAQTPHFRNYTVDDGLPSSHVYRAFQDSKGFMWFCTDKGIARFDGYKFEKFTTKNGLPNNDIWHCAEDSQQRIWFLSYANAFFYFDLKDGKFHVIENPYKELHDTHIWCYVSESKNIMKIILGQRDILLLDVEKKKASIAAINYAESYPLIKNNSFFSKKYNNRLEVWHLRAFSEGFQHNILKKQHIIQSKSNIQPEFWDKAVSIIFDDDKTIYANNDSICFFKNKKNVTRRLKDLSPSPSPQLSLILNVGNINRKLVLTEDDAFVINENIERIKSLDFIKNFNVNTIYFDNENNLWLCTKNRGLLMLSSQALKSEILSEISNEISVTTLTKDKYDRIWIGDNQGHIYILTKDNKLYLQHLNINKNIPIKKIVHSTTKAIILWNDASMMLFPLSEVNTKNLTPKTLKLEFNKTTVHQNNSNILIGLNVKNIIFLTENLFLIANSLHISLLKDYFNTFFIDYLKLSIHPNSRGVKTNVMYFNREKHIIFTGTNKGLQKIYLNKKVAKFIPYNKVLPILSKPISCFETDNEKALWVGTDGYGVYRFYREKPFEIPELSGMIINHLYFEKENNRLFVSTNEGIFVLNSIIKGHHFAYKIKRISLAQGLPTLEVNSTVVRDGKLFVGTSKGLATLPLNTITQSSKEKQYIPLIIKNIKINRQDTTIHTLYNLNYRQNNLDIEFVALSFKSDKNIKYNYKMLSSNDNTDTAWHSVQDLHKEFSLLASGKYEFHLQGFDIDGTPSQPIKPITFIINPPFWQTLWFKTFIVSVILALIILYFFIRTKNIKKKEEEKTEINKKFAELELQALQAQMNPHFVFNALSAIQNFILNNNTEEATNFLSKFSRLMRLFLESSRNKYIALSEEKVLLEYYIQLEELRFKGKFTSKIQIDTEVSLDTEIPSMLLQPFVENAINHGLVYKENNDGFLHIQFKQDENKLICIIEDNGIGRQKAAEIKSKSLKPYKSRSTEITEERLRSLELIENTKIEVSIIDKQDTNQTAIGTKVMIVMYL
ncbi:two-component regulator propeller domain-containing protein [Arcicella sp. LKC2W]|uniref:sensor histidine kinase n=1 Tax=Arcicella sp. LKC2W TaxID=2984198 RepID=UPI002B1FAC4B|nr:two-component regulator propeller domain-containing protein [Arcicella sp. LKC2W]MEA5459888.1 two-component regulator propeller domain-containing protein [Arcicella sp. LKC2W]